MQQRIYLCAAALAVVLVATVAGSPAGAAVTVITASCVDGNYGDGVDTTGTAAHCATALTRAGYLANDFTNTDAGPVLASMARDGVFFQNGHSLVVGGGNNATAVATVLPAVGLGGTLQGLLGDPLAADFQGPSQVCGDNGCRNVTLLTTPYTSAMAKFNLALFESCNSSRDGVQGFTSLATVAYNADVGTAIGFRDVVFSGRPNGNYAGDAFARRFWGDAQSGLDLLTATVDAANAGGYGYGYGSYSYLHHSGAARSMYPAQYYVP